MSYNTYYAIIQGFKIKEERIETTVAGCACNCSIGTFCSECGKLAFIRSYQYPQLAKFDFVEDSFHLGYKDAYICISHNTSYILDYHETYYYVGKELFYIHDPNKVRKLDDLVFTDMEALKNLLEQDDLKPLDHGIFVVPYFR